MRMDRFFYIPLNCSLYDKDIGYISGKKSCCQFHKSSYRSSSGFTLVRHKCSAWSILILFLFVRLGIWVSRDSFPCPPHREPGVALLRFEEHRPQCPNVHGGGMIIGATRTRGQRGTCPGMIFRCQLPKPTSLIWKISQYCTYEHWTKWESSFRSGKCYWAFTILCALHQGKSRFFGRVYLQQKSR